MADYFEPFPGTRGDELGNFAKYRTQPHRGNDWSGNEGKLIPAITTGRVKQIFKTAALGNCLIQSTGDGLFILYAHMAKPSSRNKGDMVIGGQTVIGIVGNTGTATTGAHLHTGLSTNANPHLAAVGSLRDLFDHIDANSPATLPKKQATPLPKKQATPAKPKAKK